MNSKLFLTAVAVTAASFMTSCVEEETIDANVVNQTIIAEMAEPAEAQQSRTCVDVNNTNADFTGLLWQPEDKIGVFSQAGNENAQFLNNATTTVSQTEFSGQLDGTAYYAYYPYSSENNGQDVTKLKGTLLAEQAFNPESGSLVCDYKYGTLVSRSDNTLKFKFNQLFTMLRITLDASDTALEGEKLNYILLKVIDTDGNERPICGDFTFDATATYSKWEPGDNTSGTITMPWTTQPSLVKGKSYLGFVTMMPVVKTGNKLYIEVVTNAHKASFTAESQVDFESGYIYNIPLKLKDYEYNKDKFGYKEEVIATPSIEKIETFGFEVSKNTGKLLAKELKWNSSTHAPSSSSVSTLSAAIDDDKSEITLTVPYLYDFKLKPTFTVSATDAKVLVNGVEQVSGSTEVDFTQPVTYTVVSSTGGTRSYTVKITNTGLPVVVIEQSGDGDFSEVTTGGFLGIGAKTLNKFVDIWIRGKDTEWVENDKITVYNSDGTQDCSVYGGVRLRGNTSQEYPKKPFAMKFTSKTSVLGMPKHKRWVLLANWLDHSMIRNSVAFDIAHAIENAWRQSNGLIEPGVPWNVHGQHVELVFMAGDNAYHVGNYFLCEQIKIDENRLNISKPYEDGGNGYLFEVDNNYDETYKFKTSKAVPFMFKDDVTDAIVSDVKTKIQRIETNLYEGTEEGFGNAFTELDVNSVVDQWLALELGMNREYGDPRSVYMFMDGDGKLSGGPVWDFDRGTFQNQEKATELGNSTSYRVKPDNEWMCWRTQESDTYSYVWYKQLIKSSVFQRTVQMRWSIIKPYLDQIVEQIQAYGQSQAKSYIYDSAMWPTNKADIQKYKSDFKDWSGDEQLGANGNYQEVINNFVTVYQERLDGINTLITSGKFTK